MRDEERARAIIELRSFVNLGLYACCHRGADLLEADAVALDGYETRLARFEIVGRQMLEAFDAIILQCGDGSMPKGWLAAANAMRQLVGQSSLNDSQEPK